MSEPRSYRFAPPDRTGALLGLAGPQVVALGSGLVAAVMLASFAGAGLVAMAIPVAAGAAAAFVRIGGQPAVEAAPPALRWAATGRPKRRRWLAPLPPSADATTPSLPAAMDGQEILAVDPEHHGLAGQGRGPVAVVVDRRSGVYAATIRVGGSQFALLERGEQEHRLELWGNALAPFARERAPISSVTWSEWAAPTGGGDQLAYLAEHADPDADDPAQVSYRGLLSGAGPLATRHEVLITVRVSRERVPVPSRHRHDRDAACIEALLEQVRLLSRRLAAAGLAPSQPQTPEELARALRVRLDPPVTATLDRRGRSLGELAGLVSPSNGGPLAAESAWGHWRVDGSFHRAFWIAEWPRQAVGPAWMSDLVLYGAVVRTVAVTCEPVPPRASQRSIDRAGAKLTSDEDHRRRTGFRVGAGHRRAQADVDEREEELVAGYAEFAYAGIVVVSAPDLAALERASADLDQVAAGCAIELRALNGRHDLAVGASLPLARALVPRRVW